MLKRLSLALAGLFLLASSAFAAGTLPGFSLSQQMGKDGKPLAGCVLKFYQAGTVATPQTAYQDSGLTIPVSGGTQMTCDAFGRISQFFLADGSIKILLTDKSGVTQVTADGLLVVGASSGGGGGSPVDPTTVLSTGDMKVTYGTGVLSGFVRANGRTIGSASSGASERANADTQALFLYLWGADANLAVSGGRGANAAADWAANKAMALPDWRGRTIAGLDDMGNTAAGVLTTSANGFGAQGGFPTVLGQGGGLESVVITQSKLPNVTLDLSGTLTSASSLSNIWAGGTPTRFLLQGGATPINAFADGTGSNLQINSTGNLGTACAGVACKTVSINGGVLQTGLPNIAPTRLLTIYMKL